MAGVHVDTRELTELALRFRGVPADALVRVQSAVQEAGTRLRDDARSRARGIGPHARGYPSKITAELQRTRNPSVEVGPILGGQGSLGGILEFGSPTSGPHPHLHPAFDAEVPRFDKAVAKVVDDAVEKAL